MTTYLTVAIPYVNSAPHLGYAFELIEADLVARARRELGESVRFLGGTDDHSLKNVIAAERSGQPVRGFVDAHADRFEALAEHLDVTFDDFIRTSRDTRHRPAVERLWRACARSGDLFRRKYEGRYCVGCEQFYEGAELDDGRCPEHRTPVEPVAETNWFFRLSRYAPNLIELIESGRLEIGPEPFRREALTFVRSGLRDISVSRSVERAHGWGIPVPDDPSQVVYVWFDALTNYISALGYGTGSAEYTDWWCRSNDRIHVIGKGILRFHAVYWPAFLLSAGLPLPTHIHVHPYLTAGGRKLSKSRLDVASSDPFGVTRDFGSDRLRWWCARAVSPASDTDFSVDRLTAVADEDLANGFGNAVSRVATLVRTHRDGRVPDVGAGLLPEAEDLARRTCRALADADRRTATTRIVDAVDAVNRYLEAETPWRLARDDASAERFDQVIETCVRSLCAVADAIEPITPEIAARVRRRFDATLPVDDSAIVPRLS